MLTLSDAMYGENVLSVFITFRTTTAVLDDAWTRCLTACHGRTPAESRGHFQPHGMQTRDKPVRKMGHGVGDAPVSSGAALTLSDAMYGDNVLKCLYHRPRAIGESLTLCAAGRGPTRLSQT